MTIITLLTLISIGGVDVVVKTNTTDVLTFIKGEALELHATMYNFSQNDSNLSILTTPSATLVANDNTNSATNTYNVYLIIEENGITYSTGTDSVGLLLTVKNPAGEFVTEIGYLKVQGTSVDIISKMGVFTIANDYEITTADENNTITHNWEVTVTLVNLDKNQNENIEDRVKLVKEDYATNEMLGTDTYTVIYGIK
ncbi:MAG: hypothetical protein E7172_02485 [Firmicutes bacterium]|nr:hypothetical protein [Bacillota bacterium]